MPQLPKTLVISSYAPPMIGGPVLFFNLFSQLPSDRYHILTDSRMMRRGIDPSTWLAGPYSLVDQPSASKEDIVRQLESASLKSVQLQTAPMPRLLDRFYKVPGFRELFNLAGMIKTIRQYIRQAQKIQGNDFQLLMGISDTGPALIATYFISRLYKVPYCYYMFDLYYGNQLGMVEKITAKIFERFLFTRSRLIIVNNEGTAAYYKKRYGNAIRLEIIHNGVFPEKYPLQDFRPVQPPYEIIFTGNISWPQEESVLNLLRAAETLRDMPLTIKIYTHKPPEKIVAEASRHANVLIDYAPYSEMPRIQGQASLLFLPLAWNTKAPDIIATATPGKFTDYLASGRPMLIHAPDYAYISFYGKEKDVGLVVDQDNVQLLAKTIREFFEKPIQAHTYVSNARRIFDQNHDVRKNAEKLTRMLPMLLT